MSYNKASKFLGITTMAEHQSILCNKLFDAIVADLNQKRHGLMPQKNNASYSFSKQLSLCFIALPHQQVK